MSKDGMVSITIDTSDYDVVLAEYAQEIAKLKLTRRSLIRRVNALEIELAAATKKEVKAETTQGEKK